MFWLHRTPNTQYLSSLTRDIKPDGFPPPSHWKHIILTTEPPGKFQIIFFFRLIFFSFYLKKSSVLGVFFFFPFPSTLAVFRCWNRIKRIQFIALPLRHSGPGQKGSNTDRHLTISVTISVLRTSSPKKSSCLRVASPVLGNGVPLAS